MDATRELQILDVAVAVSGLLLTIFMAIVIKLNQTIDIRTRWYAYSLLIVLGGFSASDLAVSSALLFGDAHAGLLIHGGTFFIYVFACFFSISITHYFKEYLAYLIDKGTLCTNGEIAASLREASPLLFVIGFAAADLEGTINLFQQHYARQIVG